MKHNQHNTFAKSDNGRRRRFTRRAAIRPQSRFPDDALMAELLKDICNALAVLAFVAAIASVVLAV